LLHGAHCRSAHLVTRLLAMLAGGRKPLLGLGRVPDPLAEDIGLRSVDLLRSHPINELEDGAVGRGLARLVQAGGQCPAGRLYVVRNAGR
jgi:hypothetical protein